MIDRSGPSGRLFIAAPLPGKMARVLADYARACERQFPGRYVPLEHYHVTLAFLGDTALGAVPDLEPLIAETAQAFAQFRTDFTQAGYFGRPSNAIVWAGMEEGARIVKMADMLRQGLDSLGFSFDRKPVRPHITLARKVNLEHRSLPDLPHCAGTVDAIVLYESARRGGRLTYTPLLHKYLR